MTGDGAGNPQVDRIIGAGLMDSCAGCHGRPRGSAGFGGLVVTRPDSRDAPHLFGLGLKEMLADQITDDLRDIRDDAINDADRDNRTVTRSLRVSVGNTTLSFGFIRAFPNRTYFKPATGRQTSTTSTGRSLMAQIGCTSCHVPDMVIRRDRRVADVETVYDPSRGNPFNPLFATANLLLQAVPNSGNPPVVRPVRGSFTVRNISPIPAARQCLDVPRMVGIFAKREADLPDAVIDALLEVDERPGAPERLLMSSRPTTSPA